LVEAAAALVQVPDYLAGLWLVFEAEHQTLRQLLLGLHHENHVSWHQDQPMFR
jgi:hypothetical protein